MNKFLSYSLLGFGGLIIAYPFLKKKKVIPTTDEFLLSESNPDFCKNITLKRNLLISEYQNLQNKIKELREKRTAKLISYEEASKIEAELNKQWLNKEKELDINKIQVSNCSKEIESCIALDKIIKQLKDNISEFSSDILKPLNQRKNKYSDDSLKSMISKSNEALLKYNNEFSNKNCRNVIENLRLEESGFILTKQSEKIEKNTLDSNFKEQYIYIGLGSVVLFTALYIISKKQ